MNVEVTIRSIKYVFVSAESNATKYKLAEDHIGSSWLEKPNKYGCEKTPIPIGKYEIIGFASALTEEQAKTLVGPKLGYPTYKTAFLEKLHSVYEIYTTNPYGKKPDAGDHSFLIVDNFGRNKRLDYQKWKTVSEKWLKAESRTSKEWLILKNITNA